MGLTASSTGKAALDRPLILRRERPDDRVLALAGNPNVGKSTVFNQLTGMNQHTGNWPGKTVANAQGRCEQEGHGVILVDLPGTYSLMAHSAEEETARDFLCFGEAEGVIVVCDATCLERNLNLVFQILEITPRVTLCLNLMDEAQRKRIQIDHTRLEQQLGIPVVPVSARSGRGLEELLTRALETLETPPVPPAVRYPLPIEHSLERLAPAVTPLLSSGCSLSPRWVSLKLLMGEEACLGPLGISWEQEATLLEIRQSCWEELEQNGIPPVQLPDRITAALVMRAEELSRETVHSESSPAAERDRRLDRILTNRWTGTPIMLLLLGVVFWLTIQGANLPSQLLADGLFWVQDRLSEFFCWANAPEWLRGLLVDGCYRTLAWVVAVMLPPMAIFFPLFTLLEDFGYLPRVAFNLDHHFRKAKTCGKQALTICMGFGCNAAGVTGCRIIDSPRERLIAILTNSFVPCNGRLPTLIAVLTMFFAGAVAAPYQSFISALMLTGLILFSVLLTFWISRLLSQTVLKGMPSAFALELPPYRHPQIGRILIRSLFDRTLFVLGRAAAVAAPAGILLWLLANLHSGDQTLLQLCADFLDPLGQLLGLDGVILLAFILAFPANEIVIPILLMTYLSAGSLMDYTSLSSLQALLADQGWTWVTAVSFLLFCLVHWPCSTTCLTIKKETGSWKWTAAAFFLPTALGMLLCFLFHSAVQLLGIGG